MNLPLEVRTACDRCTASVRSHAALARACLFLFAAFLAHDALQETLAHGEEGRNIGNATAIITMMDFLGCAVWSYVCMRWEQRVKAAASSAIARTPQSRDTSAVQIEMMTVHSASSPIASPSSSPSTSSSGVVMSVASLAVHFCLGLMILASNLLGVFALAYVSYPIKVIIRSCKLIPTMIIGRMVMGRRYDLAQYTAAACLCIGVVLFSFADIHATNAAVDLLSSSVPDSSLVMVGVCLLAASVIVDAINPNVSEYVMSRRRGGAHESATRHAHDRDAESVNRFMFYTNASMLPVLVLVVLFSGELAEIAPLIASHPSLLLLMLLYASASYAGVRAYTGLIKSHGSTTAVGMATLRKVVTLVLSYMYIPAALPAAANLASGATAPTPTHYVKHFGTAHVLPSAMILFGLLLSAWTESRNKSGGRSNSASPRHAGSDGAGTAMSDHASRLGVCDSSSAATGASSSRAPLLIGSNSSTGLLHLRDLGLGLESEIDDTDAELSDDARVMAKHAHHFSDQLEQALGEEEMDEGFI